MPPFVHLWPWVGLGLTLVLLFGLVRGDLRGDRSVPRTRDVVWLTWAATAAYMLHQFEEHGIDARGVHYAFRGALCATFGFGDIAECRVPEAFITAVNIPVVWIAGPVCALLGRRWPAIALGYFGVLAINAIAHIAPAIKDGVYNPGLLTSVLLFLPLSLWTMWVALFRPRLGMPAIAAMLLGGVIVHAVLFLSLKAYLDGMLGGYALLAVQIVNPALLILVSGIVMAYRSPRPLGRVPQAGRERSG